MCREIEKTAIDIKDDIPTTRYFFSIKGNRVYIDSIFEKSLYTVKKPQIFNQQDITPTIEIDMDSFYNIFFVDEELLKKNISQILLDQSQCTLAELSSEFPITKGISELVSYLSIAKNSDDAIVDDVNRIQLDIIDADGNSKRIILPNIIFTKEAKK